MRFSITWKLLSAVFATTVLAVCLMLLAVQWSFGRGFLEYVKAQEQQRRDRLVAHLAARFKQDGGWGFVAGDRRAWRDIVANSFADGAAGYEWDWDDDDADEHGWFGRDRHDDDDADEHGWFGRDRHDDDDADEHGWFGRDRHEHRHRPDEITLIPMALFNVERQRIVGRIARRGGIDYLPITVDGGVVGYLGVKPIANLSALHDVRFARHLTRTFFIIAAVILVLTLALVWPLSRRLVRPIKEITQATKRLGRGKYDTRINVDSKDELGELSRDFNLLARALQANETARRQWIADISHELRTPLAILRGEIEALQDGVREYTPQRLAALHAQVISLNRLVDDLYELSMSDIGALDYHKETADVAALLRQYIAAFADDFAAKNIAVAFVNRAADDSLSLNIDVKRFGQLFANLFANTRRYTDSGGRMRVTVDKTEREALIEVEDSAPGVADKDLERLFDRLYRVETSRSKATGGTGLGLAICRNIVEAHGGSIAAAHSELGGVKVHIALPL